MREHTDQTKKLLWLILRLLRELSKDHLGWLRLIIDLVDLESQRRRALAMFVREFLG